MPAPGEPGSETWKGKGIEHGAAAAWFTGVYDASTDTVFWQAGNPGEDYNGDDRLGDNLYSDSILALDAKTGKLKWHYQTTPHDLWDWDTTETPLVIDANWQGRPRKLLVQGNRNGFFYVFDRMDGKLLLAKQFLKELTWASGIGPDGRPVLNPNQEPSPAGTQGLPVAGRRDELVFAFVQSGDRVVLYADEREVFDLYEEAGGVCAGPIVPGRRATG